MSNKMLPIEVPDRPGARWVRAALQVNPYEYVGHPSPKEAFESEDEYNRSLLEECLSLQIGMIAVTDHWRANSAEALLEMAEEYGIRALPGFEAITSEGIHLLGIFPAGTSVEYLTTLIGQCGGDVRFPHQSGNKGFEEVARTISEAGGLAAPAHANTPNGLLTQGRGAAQTRIINSPTIDCIGISPDRDPAPIQEAVVNNRSPYNRERPLTVFHGDDVSSPSKLHETGATSWFKMDDIGLDALKLAMRASATRVRLADPSEQNASRIVSISWRGGYLDGVKVPFGDDLTALIGGRGAGKTTVIESIRFALGNLPRSSRAALDNRNIVKDVLGSGAIVTLEIHSTEFENSEWVVERAVGDETARVSNKDGIVSPFSPSELLPEFDLFGQHELAELVHDKLLVADAVSSMFGDSSDAQDLEDSLSRLKSANLALATAESSFETLERNRSELQSINRQLAEYGETRLDNILAGKNRHDTASAKVRDSLTAIATHRASVGQSLEASVSGVESEARKILGSRPYGGTVGDDRRPDNDFVDTVEDSTESQITNSGDSDILDGPIAELNKIYDQLSSNLKAEAGIILQHFDEAERRANEVNLAWLDSTLDVRTEHEGILRGLQQGGLEVQGYLRLSEQRRQTERVVADLLSAEDELREAQIVRTECLANVRTAREARNRRIRAALGRANMVQPGMVKVVAIEAPKDAAYRELVGTIRGRKEQVTRLVSEPDFDVSDFAFRVRAGSAALMQLGLSEIQAAGVIGMGEPFLRELEEVDGLIGADVQLNIAEDHEAREFRSIERLSKGQLATAFLLLLLGKESGTLVIDQPEDDLDNRFIYKGIVTRLRELKGMRQVIVSTHNANIPVLGDAELIIPLVGSSSTGGIASSGIGSIDRPSMKKVVEQVLEGGPEAFIERHRIYGF